MLCHAGVQVVLHLCLRVHLLQLMRHVLMSLRVLFGLHVLTGPHLSQIGGQNIISKALSTAWEQPGSWEQPEPAAYLRLLLDLLMLVHLVVVHVGILLHVVLLALNVAFSDHLLLGHWVVLLVYMGHAVQRARLATAWMRAALRHHLHVHAVVACVCHHTANLRSGGSTWHLAVKTR